MPDHDDPAVAAFHDRLAIALGIREETRQMATADDLVSVRLYRDESDPNDPGMAYQIHSRERGDIESGPIDDLANPWGEVARLHPRWAAFVTDPSVHRG